MEEAQELWSTAAPLIHQQFQSMMVMSSHKVNISSSDSLRISDAVFRLNSGIVKSPLGGDFLTMQCKQLLDSKDIEVIPPYMIAAKEAVKDFEKPKWTRKSNLPEVTKSWHNYMMKVILESIRNNTLVC